MKRSIKWNRRALKQLDELIAYIEEDSPFNAEKVRNDILQKINALLEHPESNKPDKYKINNDSTFRAFEIHRHRISYRYKGIDVRIIRIRHTKMNPLKY
jgi:plasmid stabilization system protein ParE